MLTRRIIPCLDVDGGRVVKGVSFVDIRDAGDPAELAAYYDNESADELVFLDITASSDGRDTMVDVVKRVSSEVFIPLTVGGGLRNVEDMRRMLEAGADKVSVNTAAVKDPSLIERGAAEFGQQCIVLAMDVKRVERPIFRGDGNAGAGMAEAPWQVYTHGGRFPTAVDPIKWARIGVELGAGELLVTSMDADGQKTGYDLELLSAISRAVNVPLIASGGAGTMDHMHDALTTGKADAVLAASVFHYGELRIRDVKGVSLRPGTADQDRRVTGDAGRAGVASRLTAPDAIVFDCYDTLFHNPQSGWQAVIGQIAVEQGLRVDAADLYREWKVLEVQFRGRRVNVANPEFAPPFMSYEQAWAGCFEEAFRSMGLDGDAESAAKRCVEHMAVRPPYPETA